MVNLNALCNAIRLRSSFNIPSKDILQWFPGHMGRGLKQMQQKLKSVDCIIEVHDARIPISGRNLNFKSTVSGLRPHILVLNKKDLADLKHREVIETKLKKDGISNIFFTNCKDQSCSGLHKVVPSINNLLKNVNRHNRSELEEYCVMVIGVPNVGKSSLINALRNRYLKKEGSAPVGAVAGITKSVASRIKVCQDPRIYVLDTPGILTPYVTDLLSGMKLALCSSMQDHLVGRIHIADYLLYWLNKSENFSYAEYLGLKEPCDDISEVLFITALNLKKTIKVRNLAGGYTIKPDLETAAAHFVKAFRTGMFGKIMLDEINT